ncbi:MAG: Gfo/Idh/MocA family protein [Halobacteriaceae archaeon]
MYRAGIVGAGGAAGLGLIGTKDEAGLPNEGVVRASHAGAYAATDGVTVAAIAELDDERRATFGDRYGVPEAGRYDDAAAMLAAEELDVVSVCTPTHLHREHVLAAADSAADPDVVWCEKPIATSVADAREMVDACEAADADLLVNHTRRFDPTYRALHDRLDELVGDPRSLHVGFKRELLRNGTHVADAAAWLLGDWPDEVAGTLAGEEEATAELGVDYDVDDSGGAGVFTYDDGRVVTLDCTVSREHWTGFLQVTGTDGSLYCDENGDWVYRELTAEGHVEADLPDPLGGPVPDLEASFAGAAANVVGLLDGDATNRSPGHEAVRTLEMLVGLFVAGYTGGTVSLPLADPLRDADVTSW